MVGQFEREKDCDDRKHTWEAQPDRVERNPEAQQRPQRVAVWSKRSIPPAKCMKGMRMKA